MSNDAEGLRVARRIARWHMGDASWADVIIAAYKNPSMHERELDAEISEGE